MAVKQYKAHSIHEAITQIKEDFGPDAMILSTKRIPKGFLDPYGKDLFEISASDKNSFPEKPLKSNINQSSIRLAGKPQTFSGAVTEPCEVNEWAGVRDELISIKDMLYLMNQGENMPDLLKIHPACLTLYTKLVQNGMSSNRIRMFLKKAGAFDAKNRFGSRDITKKSIRAILTSIKVENPFSGKKRDTRIAAFVGPTGVGKTTTIAKLAAELSLKQKKKVGIISIDSYRIGAVEQLKTYASIMGLPCLPAFSKQDLEIALEKMQNREIILIDTAGHSHLDMARMNELDQLMAGKPEISTHLVLSATTKRQDMKDAAENFSILNPESYVFTKVDETQQCGVILDQIAERDLPVSFITNGQSVPEDIMPATQKEIMKLVMR
ncbi:MAG: flagellar biosynthesis protein FlhF [Desulfobacterales bacterium]|nr:flagellar biosynthesis protein FlhF [Desulfobacterales bacterium]